MEEFGMKQKKIGNDTERKCLDLLQGMGYWCHLFAYNKNGQPCDVVAIKDNKAFLVDVKHCDGDRFSFGRIEPNQRNCFEYALTCGNGNCGFMIYYEKYGKFNYVSYSRIKSLELSGEKSVKFDSGSIV